jgi:hypothetical protein
MEFSVNTKALPGLSRMLDRRRDDLVNTRDYVAKYTAIPLPGQGILNSALGTHAAIVAAVEEFLLRAAHGRAAHYSGSVSSSEEYYLRADLSAAAALDVTYAGGSDASPAGPGQRLANQHWGPEVFDDTSQNPGLPVPHDYHRDFEIFKDPTDALSPTTDLRAEVWKASSLLVKLGLLKEPVDFFEEVCKPLVGDWAAFAACADVFANVATVLDFESGALDQGANVLTTVWTGNAAHACQYALDLFGFDLQRSAETVRGIAEMYKKTSEAVKEQSELLITQLTLLSDACVDVIEICSGDAIAAELNAPSLAVKFVRMVTHVISIVNNVRDLIRLYTAAGQLAGSSVGILTQAGPLTLTEISGLPPAGLSPYGDHTSLVNHTAI